MTRARILREASRLFSRFGYHPTTTREIAQAVGIRQPSLFHHFASKAAIMEALFESDLALALAEAEELAASEAPASARLASYIRGDIERVAASEFHLGGAYRDEVMADPDFASWAAKRDELHEAIDSIVRQGVEAGEFISIRPEIAREMIIGALARVMSVHSGRGIADAELGETIAMVLIRGLLRDPMATQGPDAEAAAGRES